jgi:hypothetical protein
MAGIPCACSSKRNDCLDGTEAGSKYGVVGNPKGLEAMTMLPWREFFLHGKCNQYFAHRDLCYLVPAAFRASGSFKLAEITFQSCKDRPHSKPQLALCLRARRKDLMTATDNRFCFPTLPAHVVWGVRLIPDIHHGMAPTLDAVYRLGEVVRILPMGQENLRQQAFRGVQINLSADQHSYFVPPFGQAARYVASDESVSAGNKGEFIPFPWPFTFFFPVNCHLNSFHVSANFLLAPRTAEGS